MRHGGSTGERVSKILDLYRAGFKVAFIAAEVACSPANVTKTAHRYGLRRRPYYYNTRNNYAVYTEQLLEGRSIRVDNILKLYAEGVKIVAIACELGCSPSNVSMVAKRHGLKMRSPHQGRPKAQVQV